MNVKLDMDPSSLTLARETAKSGAPSLSPAAQKRMAEAQQAARDFETLFVDIMMKSMRKTALPEENSNALDIYQGMLDSEYSKSVAATGGMGIQSMVMDWMAAVEPELKGMAGQSSSAAAPNENLSALRKAKQEMALQQYRLQAAMALPDGD